MEALSNDLYISSCNRVSFFLFFLNNDKIIVMIDNDAAIYKRKKIKFYSHKLLLH